MTLPADLATRTAAHHLAQRDRAQGNAAAYATKADAGMRRRDVAEMLNGLDWSMWWRDKAAEHDAAARAICPAADTWDEPGPAFVGGAR